MAAVYGVTVAFNATGGGGPGSNTVVDNDTTDWLNLVYPASSYSSLTFGRKIYYESGQFPAPANYAAADSFIQACCDLGMRATICYKPKTNGSDATALYASIAALASVLATAGAPAPVIVLWQEPQDSQNLGTNSAAYISCVYNYQHHIRSTLGLKLVYDGAGHATPLASAFFPGPPNSGPAGKLTTALVDGVGVDMYANTWNTYRNGKSYPDPFAPWISLALDNGLTFGVYEIGNENDGTDPGQSEVTSYLTDPTYGIASITTGGRVPTAQLDQFLWYQNDAGSGANILPSPSAVPASSDYRIAALRALVPGITPPAPPLPVPGIPVFPAGYGPQAADFTGWVQNPFSFLTGGAVFRAHQATSQSLASGSTVIKYDTVDEDPAAGWSAVATSSQPAYSWLAPYTGTYEVTVSVSCQAQAVWLSAAVQVSGGTIITGSNNKMTSGLAGGAAATFRVQCTGGTDYIQGVALASAACTTSTPNAGRQPAMEITYVSQ